VKILKKDAVRVARDLIGWQFLVRENDGQLTGGIITETEAYKSTDAASHTYKGKTARNSVMFGPAGKIYVYFTYGKHWCVNIVTGKEDDGQAVLIRSIQATHNLELMRQRRKNKSDTELTNGPAKVCQAMAITGADYGQIIGNGRFFLLPSKKTNKLTIKATTRIGITRDTHRMWRFILQNR